MKPVHWLREVDHARGRAASDYRCLVRRSSAGRANRREAVLVKSQLKSAPTRLKRSAQRILSGVVHGHQPGFPDGCLGAGHAQARGLEIGPSLLRAIAADRMNVEPIGFRKYLWHAGFDGRGKSRENDEGGGGSEEGSDCRGKSFEHDGPHVGRFGPSLLGTLVTMPGFGTPSSQ
jgi:hypothetical protein